MTTFIIVAAVLIFILSVSSKSKPANKKRKQRSITIDLSNTKSGDALSKKLKDLLVETLTDIDLTNKERSHLVSSIISDIEKDFTSTRDKIQYEALESAFNILIKKESMLDNTEEVERLTHDLSQIQELGAIVGDEYSWIMKYWLRTGY